jgi:ribosomal protein L24
MSTGNQTRSAIAFTLLAISAFAQTQPAASRSQITGTVTSVGAGTPQLSLKSDRGAEVSVLLTDHTVIRRIPPGETDPRKGAMIALRDVTAGDRAVIVGPPPADPKTWVATAVLVMTRGDVASLRQKDQEDWKRRGSTGIVTAVDPVAGTVTIRGGQHTYAVRSSEETAYLRYALDSPRFADARPSTFAEIKTGDQMRVLGDKNEDGATILAEKVVSGSFRQIAATIISVNPQTGEVTIKDLATKKPLIMRVDTDSTMKKLPEQAGRTLAGRYAPGARAAGAGNGSGEVGQMLDTLPAMPLSELKPGDAIMVSSTQGSSPGRVTAIMLLAGVEPLLTASSTATRDILSGWSIGGGDTSQ